MTLISDAIHIQITFSYSYSNHILTSETFKLNIIFFGGILENFRNLN